MSCAARHRCVRRSLPPPLCDDGPVCLSKVRPIRNKKCRVSGGGGFCSAVALSIASAARRRGWEGTGGAGGALAIAEAIAESMRGERTGSGEGPKISDISVAPNGFINFGAEFGSPPTSVSSDTPKHARTCVRCSGPG